MYKCPGCGAELRFDIKTQMLVCDHCSTTVDPYKYEGGDEAEKEDDTTYGVNVFRCPECGGEIVSTSTAAAEFCSYCGASVVLESRLSREKKPEAIIPFTKTKDDCKEAYKKMMKGAIFAPKDLKDNTYIDSFRGIYMPYWMYDVENKGLTKINGSKTHHSGDYRITDNYDLVCDVDAEYDGISYDASSSFDDNISDSIAPYNVKGLKKFTPGIMCGFYADTADVDKDIYEKDATEFADKETEKKVTGNFHGYEIGEFKRGYDQAVSVKKASKVTNALYPVWFLSYRKGDRVAYATINGQTGKASADMPVDIKKYVIGSLLLAVPIFALLVTFMTITAKAALKTSIIFSFIAAIMYDITMHSIIARETHADDRGYKAGNDVKTGTEKKKEKKKRSGFLTAIKSVLVTLLVLFDVFAFMMLFTYNLSSAVAGIASMIVVAIGIFGGKSYRKVASNDDNSLEVKSFFTGYSGIMVAAVISFFIMLINPVADYYYYGGAIISLAAIGFSFAAIMKRHNIIATRPLPVFNRKGGDDRA